MHSLPADIIILQTASGAVSDRLNAYAFYEKAEHVPRVAFICKSYFKQSPVYCRQNLRSFFAAL